MLGRIKALWLLGSTYLVTLLRARLGLGRARDLRLFERNYAADRLYPMTRAQRVLLIEASGCIACGRCNVGDAAIIARAAGRYPGLMTLVLAGARSTPDFAAASEAWGYLQSDDLARREALCPTAVPLVRLRQYVIERGEAAATPKS